jgi:hypothetical protein
MPLDPRWTAVDQILPDARTRRPLNEQRHAQLGWMEPVFCSNCGRPGGLISRDWAAHVFYLCDSCEETHGHLPLPALPEALVRGQE